MVNRLLIHKPVSDNWSSPLCRLFQQSLLLGAACATRDSNVRACHSAGIATSGGGSARKGSTHSRYRGVYPRRLVLRARPRRGGLRVFYALPTNQLVELHGKLQRDYKSAAEQRDQLAAQQKHCYYVDPPIWQERMAEAIWEHREKSVVEKWEPRPQQSDQEISVIKGSLLSL